MTRVVAERTVCYCSNFDLDAAEWFRTYSQIKNFAINLHKKLGTSLCPLGFTLGRKPGLRFNRSKRSETVCFYLACSATVETFSGEKTRSNRV
jgi:hypothetical protein